MLTWLFYFSGQILHFLLKASAAVGSPQSAVTTYAAFVKREWLVAVIRMFVGTCLFILFVEVGPSLFGDFGVPAMSTLTPLGKGALAGLFGYCADNVIDRVQARFPILKNGESK